MTPSRDDEIDARVAGLPRLAPDPPALAQVHARARAAFLAAGAAGITDSPPSRRWWVALWNRALEPIIVVGIVAGYLTWTAAAMGALHSPDVESRSGMEPAGP